MQYRDDTVQYRNDTVQYRDDAATILRRYLCAYACRDGRLSDDITVVMPSLP